MVRQARAAGQALYPFGGRTWLQFGLPPTRPGRAVDLRRLNHIIDYPARDMTITVKAGITMQQLAEVLAREHQRLPVDVPRPAEATLGGAMAANVSGPRRFGHGTFRDYVIGIGVITDKGAEARAGGRVVKNVAGYDLCKLHLGALGTLGLISHVTLKLRPLPEEQALVVVPGREDQIVALLNLIHQSQTQPVAIELLNSAAIEFFNSHGQVFLPMNNWCVIVGFESNRMAAAWQVEQLKRELGPGFNSETLMGYKAEPLWAALVEFPALPPPGPGLTFQASLLPSRCGVFCQQLSRWPAPPLLQAHAGNGIVIGHLPSGSGLSLEEAARALEAVRHAAQALAGRVVVLRCPTAWKARIPVWEADDNLWLMRTIKDKMDPQNIFNPGRFLGGI